MKIPLTHWLLLIVFIFTLINQLRNKYSIFWKLFFIAIFFEMSTEFFSNTYNNLTHKNTTWIYNIIIPIQILLFSIPFIKSFKLTIYFWYIFVIYFLFAYSKFLLNEDLHKFNSVNYQVGSFLVEIIILSYLYKLFINDNNQNFWVEPAFWIAIGLFIFYIGSFIFFGFLNYLLVKNPPLASNLYNVFKNLFYVLCTFFIVANFLEWKQQKLHTPFT